MTRALLALLLLGHAALAEDEVPRTKWHVELTEEDAVPADGHHLGLSWKRDTNPMGTVLIFRRAVPRGTRGEGRPILVVDQGAQIVPAFMYPDTFKTQYYPAIDAAQRPIPKGTQLGVWTVVDSVDGDRTLWIDDVPDPDMLYLYTLVPAHRGSAADTYDTLMGSSVVTPPLPPKPVSLIRSRWFQIAIGAGLLVIATGVIGALRRRRAGAKTPGEAS